ncbi:hypothetical protein [Flavobacterium sp.]|jgi:hypothetical protein|uniref:hypothetical protein n=1 Tax=Flavobacterium sp. TaxID=239 RepID=UPI0037BF2DE8
MKNKLLENEKKITSGFIVPEDYFDNFSADLMQKLPAKEIKTISFYARNKKWIYSAAAVLVIALSLPIVFQMEKEEVLLSDTEIENYLTQQNVISEDEIINCLEKEDLVNLKMNSTVTEEAIEEELINNNELEQYITN